MKRFTYTLSTLILISTLILQIMPSLALAEGADMFESSQVCKECHVDNYRNWARSLHANSYTNPVFQTAYQKAYLETKGEAKKYCLDCHAPTVRLTKDYDVELTITREGITCDFCHSISNVTINGSNVSAKLEPGDVKRSVLKDAESPHHETAYSDDFATSKICATCHNFTNRHGIKVGATYDEWSQTNHAKENEHCQSCHMKEIPGKTANEGGREMIHDHSMARNLATMKEAVTLKLGDPIRSGVRLGIEVEIINARAGHYVPTGAPQRQLVLQAQSVDIAGRVIETQEIVYRKAVINADGAEIYSDGDVFLNGVKIISDNRLKAGEARTEKFVFSRRVADIKSVNANAYMKYAPVLTEQKEMRIPLYFTDYVLK